MRRHSALPKRKASKLLHFLEWLGFKALVLICGVLGRHGSFLLGWTLGTLLWWIGFKRRRRTLHNIELVYGGGMSSAARRRLGRRCYAFAGGFFAELLWFGMRKQKGLPRCCHIIGAERLREALRGGRGAVLISAHIGNFPLLGIYLRRFGFPVHVVLVAPFNPLIARELEQMRRRLKLPEIYVVPRKTAAIRCLNALRNNQAIWTLIDQKFHQGILINFLGHPAQVAAVTALFALRARSPILAVNIHRTPRAKHVITISEPIKVASNTKNPIIATMQKFSDKVGEFVLKYPEQWTWYHRRWQVRWHKLRKRG